MTITYLGFFVNRQTKDEFVAPVQAEDADAARWELEVAYPTSRYQLLTVYSRTEIENVLIGVDRWPGLPSKVQAPVVTDLTKVTASTGGLPPLPGQKVETLTVETQSTKGQTSTMPAWMQTYMATSRVASKPATPVSPALEQAMADSQAATPQTFGQQSLIERLKAAKGQTMASAAASMPIRREPVRENETPISRAPQGSVIDILKGMRK